jgi:predicted ATP-grasp superfamily ATP-dependent carboligase
MKLEDYLPEVPELVKGLGQINTTLDWLNLMKGGYNEVGGSESGRTPTLGIETVVNGWIRNQMAYRKQLVQDIQTIAMQVEEIRAPLHHITNEVFRRGLKLVPDTEKPNHEEIKRLSIYIDDCNVFDQSLEQVLRQAHFDLNSTDDAFIYMVKDYYVDKKDKSIASKVREIRRLNPALIEFDLDNKGLPKNSHWVCPVDRNDVAEVEGKCDKGHKRVPVMYRYRHRETNIYLFDDEIIHISKFAPSETYGWSPILTIFEKALTLIGMDKNLYRYFFERKMPSSMLMVHTDDPESLRRERANLVANVKADPNFIPMVAVSSRNQRGRVDMVRLFHTLQEMDYLPVRQEIRERVAAMWGVTPAWQGAPEAFGGLSTQTQQLVVMSRVVEGDQRIFHEKVFPHILKAFNVTDWKMELPNPEEKAEATRISFALQRTQLAAQLAQLGYTINLKDPDVDVEEARFVISGKPKMIEAQTEQMELGVEQAKQQMEQMEQQAEMEQQQQEGAGGEEQMAPELAQLLQQQISKTIPRHKRKHKGIFGRITPDNSMVAVQNETDKTSEKTEEFYDLFATKSWMQDLMEKGYPSPLVKELSEDGSKLWFSQDDSNFVAFLHSGRLARVEKATFAKPPEVKTNTVTPTDPILEDVIQDE